MRKLGSMWWLWPVAPLALLAGPSLLVANRIDEDVYERAWRTAKGLDDRTTLLMFAVLVAMAAGTMVAALAESRRQGRPGASWPDLDEASVQVLSRLYPWLIGLTLFGYGVWIALGLSRGLSLDDVRTVLTTQDNILLPVKSKLETVPGLTTLTQMAIPASIIGVLLDTRRPSASVRWAYRLTIVLGAVRAFMLAERLAVVEIVVPVIVVRAAIAGHRRIGWNRVLLAFAPLIGVGLLIIGFAVSEYSRSWNWYEDRTDVSFVEFSSERLLGYYATSHNNGAQLLKHGESVTIIPYHTTTFAWQIPPGSLVGGEMVDDVGDDRRRVLKGYANPEFNSSSGLASLLADYGTLGGVVFAFILGAAIGVLHLAFLHGRIPGLLLYPMVFTGLLELPRYLYWFQGRATPAVVIALSATVVIGWSRRARVRRPVPATIMESIGVAR